MIRAWERRYNAVEPVRSSTNRRLYSEENIKRLELLQKATALGHSIGQVAQLSTQKLQELTNYESTERQSSVGLDIETNEGFSEAEYMKSCIAAIEQFDAYGLEQMLWRASVTFSQPELIDQIVVPLIHEVGNRWQNGTLRVVHEHLASNVLRRFLGNMRSASDIPESAPKMIATTPIGQLHELGALIVAVTGASEGWHVTYLGPNLPAEEIAAAAVNNRVKAVCLSIIYPPSDARLFRDLAKLRQLLPEKTELIIGGRVAFSYADILTKIGATLIADLPSFRQELESL